MGQTPILASHFARGYWWPRVSFLDSRFVNQLLFLNQTPRSQEPVQHNLMLSESFIVILNYYNSLNSIFGRHSQNDRWEFSWEMTFTRSNQIPRAICLTRRKPGQAPIPGTYVVKGFLLQYTGHNYFAKFWYEEIICKVGLLKNAKTELERES